MLSQPCSAAMTAASDDHLIAACRALDDLERRVDAFNDPGSPSYIEDDAVRDDAIDPIEAEQVSLIDRICVTKALTMEGARARARSLLLRHKAIDPSSDALAAGRPWSDRMVAAALRDLLGAG